MIRDRLIAVAATAALAGCALPSPSQAQGRDPASGPRVSAADVVLYIDEAPCAGAAPVAEIVVQQETMPLADVLRALRLEAAHRGANGVADISVAPGTEGRFRVSGTAIRCAASGPAMPSPAMPSPAMPSPAMPSPAMPGPQTPDSTAPGSAAPPASDPSAPRPRGGPQPRAATDGVAPGGAVDARVAAFLGPALVAAVQGADRVETVHLGGRGAGGRTVQDFAVLGAGRDLSPAQVATLRRLILDPASYVFDSSKRCPFIADAGFVLHGGGTVATVALASRCNLWSFAPAAEGRAAIEDFDPAAPALKALVAAALGGK